jgi:hypothetical protein
MGCPHESRQVSWAKIEHPLCGILRVLVIAKLHVRIRQQAVDRDIVGNSLVQRLGCLQRGRILMLAQKDGNLCLLRIEIVRGVLRSSDKGNNHNQ